MASDSAKAGNVYTFIYKSVYTTRQRETFQNVALGKITDARPISDILNVVLYTCAGASNKNGVFSLKRYTNFVKVFSYTRHTKNIENAKLFLSRRVKYVIERIENNHVSGGPSRKARR